MMGHLGSRVSALLDGQLAPEEAERAWSHVHQCHACRDLVEREGWIKTRLAGLSFGTTEAPEHLKGSLLGSHRFPAALEAFGSRPRRNVGLVAIGGGAVGAAVVGVLALGFASPDGPVDRRPPVTSIRQSDPPRTMPSGSVQPTVQGHRFAGR
ncbi:MAG: anti-sigma factor family protein [Nocardioides sp.]